MNDEQLKDIARRCAKAKPKSYYAEPFEPHEWVIDAMREAADTLSTQLRELREENANWQESVQILAATAREANDFAEKLELSLATAREEVEMWTQRSGMHHNNYADALERAEAAETKVENAIRALKPTTGGEKV